VQQAQAGTSRRQVHQRAVAREQGRRQHLADGTIGV
jgi:hypothetical protein